MAELPEFQPRVLVVDRDTPATLALLDALRGEGHMAVAWARDGEVALNLLQDGDETFHAMVCELHAQRVDGLRLLKEALKRRPGLCVVVTARRAGVEAVADVVRAGALDFLPHPVAFPRLLAALRQGISSQKLTFEIDRLKEQLSDRFGFERVVGRSKAVTDLLARLRQVAPTAAPVLLLGEAGTGKALLAQSLHHNSPRRAEAFVAVQCAGMSEVLLEGELFGSPARERHPARAGRVESAAEGTLYLEEVSEIGPRLQTRLLRLLRDGRVERAGQQVELATRPRLLCSTTRDLPELVRRGKFRDDLYYELAVASVEVPPLRARREDIPLLTHALLEEINRAHGRQVTGVTRGCMDLLMQYSWPGNVRELKSVLEGVALFTEGRRALEAGDLPEFLRDRPPVPQDFRVRVGMSMAEIERRAIQETLASVSGDKARAAKILGIGLRTLYRKIKEYELA